MKKILATVVSVIVLSLTYIPRVFAGGAVLPLWYTHTTMRTHVHVTNILGISQHVTITFYLMDGTPLVNAPLHISNGGVNPVSGSTDSNGSISVELPPRGQVGIVLLETSQPFEGHGIITGTTTSGKSVLVAEAQIQGYGPVPINGGSPF